MTIGGVEQRLSLTRLRTTPAIMRSFSIAITVVIALASVFAFLAAQELVRSTDELEQNVVPVLITSQGLVASLAEADAANTSVFLSGANEDRQQRRLYELAVERAPRQIEDVSALIGDDASAHDALKDVGSGLTAYVATVEQARAANLAGEPDATRQLAEAIDLMNGSDGMLNAVEAVTAQATVSFDTVDDTADVLVLLALIGIVIALGALVLGQVWLQKKTHRTLNPAMAVATVILLALEIWIIGAYLGRASDLDAAQADASDAIFATSSVQTRAFELKTGIESDLIGTSTLSADDRIAATEQVATEITNLIAGADNARELAAAQELEIRFARYAATAEAIANDVNAGRTDEAIARSVGDGNRDFNGFNTAVESVLSDNRDQFFDTASSARGRLNWLRLGSVVVPIVAAALALWGWQVRINEYW